jgi:hypothetical protein
LRRFVFPLLISLGFAQPALPRDCGSLVSSVCADEGGGLQEERRTLTVEVRPPAFAIGDRFPVEERSLLMNPTRYKLPPVDGRWRYYAMDGVVYRVDNATATVLEVIRDSRTWRLR